MKKTITLVILLLISCKIYAQSCTVNLLVAYTASSSDSIGNEGSMVSAITDAVESMNTINVYSRVFVHYNLVRTVDLNDFETFCFSTDLNRFQASDYIDSLRKKYHADVAILVLANNEFSGQPYEYDAVATDTTAYCAVNFSSMLNGFGFSHQVAHLFGCAHSRESRTQVTNGVYAYGHGIQFEIIQGEEYSTIATILGVDDDYFCGEGNTYENDNDNGCVVMPYYSNPELTYGGIVIGSPEMADNSRVLNENSETIGNLQPVPVVQKQLNDTVQGYNRALATATDTLGTGSYVIKDAANVTFNSNKQIVLNPGFSALEGVRFEAILEDPKRCKTP